MEEGKATIGSLREKIKTLIKALEECKKENEKLIGEIENLKRKHADTLRELEEIKALIDSVLNDEG